MKLPEALKNIGYALMFGFIGFIAGIWTADLLYTLILKNMERATTSNISLLIIVAVTVSAAAVGFTKGKKLLEDSKEQTMQKTVTGFTKDKDLR